MTEPVIISTASFRETIANEWKQCAEFKMVGIFNVLAAKSKEAQKTVGIFVIKLSICFVQGHKSE